jgi:hypothetical protein
VIRLRRDSGPPEDPLVPGVAKWTTCRRLVFGRGSIFKLDLLRRHGEKPVINFTPEKMFMRRESGNL